MGKVYDALRRAEEQRARRTESALTAAMHESPVARAEPELPPGSAPERYEPPTSAIPRAAGAAEARAARPPKQAALGSFLNRLRRRQRRNEIVQAADLNKRRIALLQPESFVAEQFRNLRARIDSLAATQPVRSIGVTSALPGDGKTMAALGLAVVSSMGVGRRVLLIDCDLRRPMIHQALGLRPDAGLAELLCEGAGLEEAICRVDGASLDVLPVRGIPSNPSELLASDQMAEILGQLVASYDRVILDLPPALGVPDAKIVSELCDGLVLVVRAQSTPEADVAGAIDMLDRRRILGLVLNGAESQAARYGYRS